MADNNEKGGGVPGKPVTQPTSTPYPRSSGLTGAGSPGSPGSPGNSPGTGITGTPGTTGGTSMGGASAGVRTNMNSSMGASPRTSTSTGGRMSTSTRMSAGAGVGTSTRTDRPIRSGVRLGSSSKSRRRGPNYRMILCGAVLVFFALTVLFFGLFLFQNHKNKTLSDELEKLKAENATLNQEKATLTQQNQILNASILESLPEPNTANTDSLSELIPQLTESLYVVRITEESKYQYLKVPDGYLKDQLILFRDSGGYAATTGAAPTCTYWVLYSDRVIGLADGDVGFVSTERSASGETTSLPAGFYQFVVSLFKQ